jgi:hypothetical protein
VAAYLPRLPQPWMRKYKLEHAEHYCDALAAHGHDDSHLLERGELNVLFENRAAIGGFDENGCTAPFLGSYCCLAVVLAVRKHFEEKVVSRLLAWRKRKLDLHRTRQTGSHRKLDRATCRSLWQLSCIYIEYLLK